ncbi:tol-pal system protein YbgF [Alkalisalibacterium limincola]|uniref:Cell division coordinator CpoB n=1 Tax=Alkalisalibacterium limincola TaxID=2699169 RepID=A0A5C8KRF7_9GAMM|nr:tol-pal system protein YbgF [Alkalisalibacterium limincola]
MIRIGVVNAVVVAVALVATAPVQAQRATLAERVAQLEQQANQPGDRQQALETLNRINELQAELAMMRGQVEQLQFELQEMQRRNRDQYIDLDSRIERLQGGVPSAGGMGAQEGGDELPMEAPALGRPSQAPSPQVGRQVDIAGEETDLGAAPAGDPADERAAYEAGFDALKDGRYAESARRFQSFIEAYPDGQYASNAWYWLGESYYVTQNFELAMEAFESLLRRHPDSAKAPDALLKLGYCQYELRDFDAAQATLNQVVQRYPDTTVARLAQGRLRALMLENR